MDDHHDDQQTSEELSTEQLHRRLEGQSKQIRSLESYNSDLQGQVKLMTAKLNFTKNYLLANADVQTEITIAPGASNGEVFTSSYQPKDVKAELDSFLEQMKSTSDYSYDAASKTYYSQSTGWYYYPESSAFYNPANQSYYRYDAEKKSYDFMYTLQKENGQTNAKTDEDIVTLSSEEEEEEGEIIELTDSPGPAPNHKTGSKRERHYSPQRRRNSRSRPSVIESKAYLRGNDEDELELEEEENVVSVSRSALNKIPPVRLIVQAAEELDIGSLLLVSPLAGKIGQHQQCALIVPDVTVSQLHAEITYDHQRRRYMVTDLCSRNGTYLDDLKLKPLQPRPLHHGAHIQLGSSCRLLAHIHQHRDITCDECLPGRIATEPPTGIYLNGAPTASAKSAQKSLKKKYGLVGEQYRETIGPELPPGYRNRAAERQQAVGSDNPYEKTGAGSALDMPLDQKNKGFQMLQKMGWKKGQGLGASETAETEPIEVDVRESRQGLGFGRR